MENRTYKTLEELYIDNRKLVFAYISDYSKEKTFIEEIASDVWSKVLEQDDTFLNMEKKGVKAYLRVMVKTTVSDHFRKMAKDTKLVKRIEENIQEFDCVEQEIKQAFFEEMQYYLRETIAMLPEEDRLLIVMRFKNNKPAKEVGELLNLTEGNVRVRQLRILAKMKKHIKELMMEGKDTNEFKENQRTLCK